MSLSKVNNSTMKNFNDNEMDEISNNGLKRM
jgi:hypothetical protein